MTIATLTRPAPPRRGPLQLLGRCGAAILRRLRAHRRQRAAREHLARLGDRLRQDIGLDDSNPIPADLLERYYRSRRVPPREHELRLKPWIDR